MIKFPKKLEEMKPEQRWEWFDCQKQILRDAAKNGDTVELTQELSECFMFMSDLAELKHCQMVALHNNAVAIAGAALIEKDSDKSRDWLLNLLEQADDATWQMYEFAEDYFQRNRLPFPESILEHLGNIKKQNALFEEDNAKFDIWYEENITPILRIEP